MDAYRHDSHADPHVRADSIRTRRIEVRRDELAAAWHTATQDDCELPDEDEVMRVHMGFGARHRDHPGGESDHSRIADETRSADRRRHRNRQQRAP